MSKKILCRVVRTAPLERRSDVFESIGQRHRISFDITDAAAIRWSSKESTAYTFGSDYSAGGSVDFYA